MLLTKCEALSRAQPVFFYVSILCAIAVAGLIVRDFAYVADVDFSNAAALICCIGLFGVAAVRANTVGADTDAYQWIYCWIGNLPAGQLFTATDSCYLAEGIEPGYRLYNWLLYRLLPNDQAITVINSLLLISFLYRMVIKNSADTWLSVYLFVAFGLFQSALNLTPSAIATVFVMSFFYLVKQRRFIPFAGIVILASCFFHLSALLFLPLYFVCNVKLSPKLFFLLLTLGILLSVLSLKIAPGFLTPLVPSSYRQYLSSNASHPEQLLVGLSLAATVALCWMLEKKYGPLFSERNQAANWFLLITIVSFSFAYFNTNFARLSLILSMYFVVAVPDYLSSIPKAAQSNGIALSRYDWASCCVVVFTGVVFVARLTVNNIGTTIPYEPFFS